MKTLAFQPTRNNKFRAKLSYSQSGFIISLLLHGIIFALFFKHLNKEDIALNGESVVTMSLATFQSPSDSVNVSKPLPRPVHKFHKKHHQKQMLKENALNPAESNSTPTPPQPKAQQDIKQEEGEIMQTLTYRNGENNEIYSQIQRAIDKNNKYPPMSEKRGIEGAVIVSFVLYANGSVANIKIIQPSSHEPFNQAAIKTIKKAQKNFPALSLNTYIEIPIEYRITK